MLVIRALLLIAAMMLLPRCYVSATRYTPVSIMRKATYVVSSDAARRWLFICYGAAQRWQRCAQAGVMRRKGAVLFDGDVSSAICYARAAAMLRCLRCQHVITMMLMMRGATTMLRDIMLVIYDVAIYTYVYTDMLLMSLMLIFARRRKITQICC